MADTFTLARRLKAGETVYTGWCGLPYPLVTEVIAREGFAAVTIDSQHGLWDTASIVAAVAAVRQGGAAPVVRVPVGGFASISRALDFGAEGIIAPMINTQEDARALAAYAKGRGFALPDDVIQYLLAHGRRDMAALVNVLAALDRYSLSTKRPITVPLLRGWFQREIDLGDLGR